MKHRERFLTAIDLREPDIVPITDLGLDSPIVEAIMGIRLGAASVLGATGRDAWERSARYREMMSQACVKLGFDAVPAISDYSLSGKKPTPSSLPEKRFVDEWGRMLESRPDTQTDWWIGGTVNTEEDVRNYVPPDPEEEGRFEMVERVIKPLREEDVAVMGQGHSGWHMAFQVRGGIDKMLIDMYRRPKLARILLEKVAGACLGMIKLMTEGGVNVIFITDDYADNRLPFMSVEMFREFELPNIRRVADLTRRKGLPPLKHSDGNIYPILDDMIEAGIRGIHPIEPGAMDLKDVKQRYGSKVCVLGNVDCRYVLPFGTEEDVRRDVRRCIDAAAEGGGYVLASSNTIHANCKVENVYTMVDEARKYGKYPL